MHVRTSPMGLTVSHPSIKQHHWLTESHKQKACFDIHLSDMSGFADQTATNSKATVWAKTQFECTVSHPPVYLIKVWSILFSFPKTVSYMDVYNLSSSYVERFKVSLLFTTQRFINHEYQIYLCRGVEIPWLQILGILQPINHANGIFLTFVTICRALLWPVISRCFPALLREHTHARTHEH